MPSKLPGGGTTMKFDQMTTVEARSTINELQQKHAQIENAHEDIYKKLDHLEDNYIQLQKANESLKTEVDRLNGVLTRRWNLVETFLQSRFVRFLNFFGRWFIYTDEGVFINPDRNAKSGNTSSSTGPIGEFAVGKLEVQRLSGETSTEDLCRLFRMVDAISLEQAISYIKASIGSYLEFLPGDQIEIHDRLFYIYDGTTFRPLF